MHFYKLNFYGMPKIVFASEFSTDKFSHNFPTIDNLLEISVIDCGFATKESAEKTEITEEKSISYIFHDFTGRVFSEIQHKHTTVGVTVPYSCERIDSTQVTRKTLNILKAEARENTIALLPHKLTSENQYKHIKQLLMRIIRRHTMRQAKDCLAALSVWFEMLSYLTEICMNQLMRSENFGISPASLLYCDKACAYINDNLNRRFKVSEIAKSINVSTNYLQSLFKQVMNVSVMDYANMLRVEIAKDYFARQNATVREAAEMFGFEDAGYFGRMFGKICGMSVQEYKMCEKKRNI